METLLQLYEFESVHGSDDEKALADFVEKFLQKHDKPYTRYGNCLFSLDTPDVPILSAHIDQVETDGKAVHFVLTPEEHIRGYTKDWERTSLGADDKNGVWLILKLIEAGFNFNFIISDGEECGCLGIKSLENLGYLKSIPENTYCIVLDRRGDCEILKSGSGGAYCSTLAQCLCNFLDNRYVVGVGTLSDTATICKCCESVNMSVAYHNAHLETEYTDWFSLQEILEDLKLILTDFLHYPTPPKVYKEVVKTSSVPSTSYYSSKWGGYYDDYGY